MNNRSELSEAVRAAVSEVTDPELDQRFGDLGMVRDVRAGRRGQVTVQIALTTPGCPLTDQIRADVSAAAAGVAGVSAVTVEFSVMPQAERSALLAPARPGRPPARAG